jgi:thymidine kinase
MALCPQQQQQLLATAVPMPLPSLRATRGVIQVIFGPMFSGKTTELVRRMKRYSVAKHRCLLVKYSADTRYSVEHVATHDRQVAAATACARLTDVEAEARDYNVIGIDEGQFVRRSCL